MTIVNAGHNIDDMSLSHPEVIALWARPRFMATAVGATSDLVRQWKVRGRIPAEWWLRVSRAAQAAGHAHVTMEALAGDEPDPVEPLANQPAQVA